VIQAIYVAAESPVHRLGPGAKLLLLPAFATALFATSRLSLVTLGLGLVLAAYVLARIPTAVLLRQIRPTAVMLGMIFLLQLWFAGWAFAALVCLRFLALILAASLVTLTTRTGDIIAALEIFFRRFAFLGVEPDKLSLAISLVIRFIPVIQSISAEVREAQAARGQSMSLFRVAVPVVVRTLKLADEVAEAIDARS
jgi:biotin transport system permease protein